MHDDHDWHEHDEGGAQIYAEPGHLFRCTYCDSIIPQALAQADLGLPADAAIEAGQKYPYAKCWCGWGKFVTCER